MKAQRICVLGSTGSIGVNTLAIAEHLGLKIDALSAWQSVERLAEQARRFRPKRVVIADQQRYHQLVELLDGTDIEVLAGADHLVDIAADPASDTVVTAIVGAAGLAPTLAAAKAGKRLAIANKEPLVMAGELVMEAARIHGARIIPVDSEHSAIFQCLAERPVDEVDRLILTASGGPFRERDHLQAIDPTEALRHPTWDMGPKISIDSATLMNKSLEIIEARWLFDVPCERIDLLVHPQSVIHSMVHFRDGSVMAQLGLPDMRVPIQYALTWPEHRSGPVAAPDFTTLGALTFEAPRRDLFPTIAMGYEAARRGGLAPVAMNAANEVAVDRFLAGACDFTDIFAIIAEAIDRAPDVRHPDLETIVDHDRAVRDRLCSEAPS